MCDLLVFPAHLGRTTDSLAKFGLEPTWSKLPDGRISKVLRATPKGDMRRVQYRPDDDWPPSAA